MVAYYADHWKYVERFRLNAMTEPEMRNVGFPWSPQLVGRTFSSCGGTVAATHLVMQQGRGIAGNIAGGTHHAFRDRFGRLGLSRGGLLARNNLVVTMGGGYTRPMDASPMQRIHYSSFRASPSVMGGCFRFATHAREVHRLPGDAL
eukprot:XP_001703724.1 predicted protein [Chlamydomonas reinhardtii]